MAAVSTAHSVLLRTSFAMSQHPTDMKCPLKMRVGVLARQSQTMTLASAPEDRISLLSWLRRTQRHGPFWCAAMTSRVSLWTTSYTTMLPSWEEEEESGMEAVCGQYTIRPGGPHRP